MHNTYYTEHKMSEAYLKRQKAMLFAVLKIDWTHISSPAYRNINQN